MSLILRCPNCKKHYEGTDDAVRSIELQCPLCGTSAAASDFSAMMFCPNCRSKLAVSLDMLTEKTLSCPRCDKDFSPTVHLSLDDENDTDFDLFDEQENRKNDLFNEGDFFDKYKIVRLLGRGGMGEVYLAEHLFLHRPVALKIMLSEVAKNSVFAKRFIREAKIANKIESENLIGVYDVGIESKTEMLFIAMEYVDGKNLSELMRENGLFSEQDTLIIIHHALNALEKMEAENVVHRDIKPSNIMIASDGSIKLADLGIAKSNNHAEGDLTLTQESMVFGTPNYASPEQCRSSHNVDTRSDIYSLGATMYHMVAGNAPFTGETSMEIMLKVLGDETPDFNVLNGFSAGFITLLTDMLQKDPAKRPQNIAELRSRIENLLDGEGVFKYKMRLLLKKALPIAKFVGLAILKAPLALFKKKPENNSAVKFLCNYALFCVLLYLGGMLAYRNRDYLCDLWIKYFEEKKFSQVEQKYGKDYIAKIRYKHAVKKNYTVGQNKKNTVAKPAVYNMPSANSVKSDTSDFKKNISENKPVQAVTADSDKQNTKPEKSENKPKVNAIDYNALEESSKLAEKEEKSPAEKKTFLRTNYPDTIDGRLERCNDIIAALQDELTKNPDNKWLEERLNFMQKTVKVNIQKQIDNRKKAELVKFRGNFDEAANNEIKSLYRRCSEKIKYWGNTSDKDVLKDLEKILNLMTTRNFDPNLQVEDVHQKNYSGTLLQTALVRRFIPDTIADRMINILLEKNILDTDIKANSNFRVHYNEKILRYGINNLNNCWYTFIVTKKKIEDKKKLIKVMTELGADINIKVYNASVLHWAVLFCDFATVKKLLLAGADISAVDSDGQTPLFWAEKYSSDAVVKLLTAVGSDTSYCDNSGKKAADYKYYREFNDALRKNNFEKIEAMLDKYPELANERIYDGSTPLYYAVGKNNVSLVKKLIAKNADINYYSPFKYGNIITILSRNLGYYSSSYNIRNKNLIIYKLLLEAGGNLPDVHSMFYPLRYFNKKIDAVTLNYMLVSAKHIKDKVQIARILKQYIYNGYFLYHKYNTDNSNARYAVVNALLKNKEIDLSHPEFKNIFFNAASNMKIQERELTLLLTFKADINAVNNNMTVLYKICSESTRYSSNPHARYGNNIPTLNDYVRRIQFLLRNGARPDIGFNGRTIADLNMPKDVENISQIRKFIRQKRRR